VTTGSAELLEDAEAGRLDPDRVTDAAARSPLQLFWRRMRADRVALAAAATIIASIVVAVAAPLVTDLAGAPGPNVQDSSALDEFGSAAGPSRDHLMGTDDLGRDVFSRVVYGARPSLAVAILATGVALLLGTVAGLVAGYYRGLTDTLIARGVDIMLAFPVLLFAVGVGFACNTPEGCAGGLIKPGISTLVVVIAIPTIPIFARLVRGQVLSLREREFVDAARILGASAPRIMFREILPNLVAPLIVYATLLIPANILFEAALSFLGVGIQEPDPSWGAMIDDATPLFDTAWWYMLFPGLAVLVTVLAFNLLGDGLRDALDPRAGR
jgi:peptide/nickel transport system permease protein